MGNPFSTLGNLNKLRQQAQQMQNDLAKQTIRVEEGDIVVEITGDQRITHFSVQGISSEDAVQVLNKAIKQSQQAAAQKLQSMSGGLGGLLGKMG